MISFYKCFFLVHIVLIAVQASHIQGIDSAASKHGEKLHPALYSLFPTSGSELGNTKLVLKGSNFDIEDNNLYCCFNETKVNAQVITGKEINCYTPPSPPGKVFVTICHVDNQSEDDALSLNQDKKLVFEYKIMATVFSLFPVSGSGGNEVTIVGSGFVNTSALSCRFDSTLLYATYISPSEIKCLSPIPHGGHPTSVLVTVSNNGVDIEGDWASVMFTYTLPLIVTSIDPITSPSTGGTSLFIYGDNFPVNDSQVIVRIGEFTSNATILSADEIVCTLPIFDLSSPKSVPIQVSVNGGNEFNIGVHPRVLIHPPTKVISVSPASVPETRKSIVSVIGSQFHRSSHLACQFGNVTVSAIWISNSLLQCEVPPLKPGTVMLGVTTNGQISGVSPDRVEFNVTNAVTLTSMSPSYGPITGGIKVYLYGSGFCPSTLNAFLCRFGNITVHASQIFNQTAAVCLLPSLSFDGVKSMPVDVSINNGHDFTMSSLQFYYGSFYRIGSLYPRMGPSIGNTTLTLFGNFTGLDFVNVQCQFHIGNLKLNSLIFNVSHSSLSCLTPSIRYHVNESQVLSHVGLVYMENLEAEIVVPLTDRGAPTNSFLFYGRSYLHSLQPSYGSELGGTNVTITGHFPRSHNLICKFDGLTSPLSLWVNKNTIICTSPPASTISFLIKSPFVNVTILINGEDDEDLYLPYQYMVATHISTITPTFGSIRGDTSVLIEGGGFPISSQIEAFCVFGGILKEAKILSDSQASCQSPRSNSTQKVSVSISFSYSNDIVPSSAFFIYIEDPIIKGIFPPYAVASHRTKISVVGEKFPMVSNGKVWCSFGGFRFSADVLNENLVTFQSPMVQERTIARVQLSFNGRDFTSMGPILSIYPAPVIEKISPNFSNEDGGIPISIKGRGFYNVPNISCLFRFSEREYSSVRASHVSLSSLTCISPPMLNEYRNKVSLELSLTGESSDVNPSIDVFYFMGVSISSILPRDCSKSHGSDLKIIGFGFGQQKSSYYCRIQELRYDPVFVPAKYQTETMIACKAPPSKSDHHISIAHLSIVILDGTQFYNASGHDRNHLSFHYVDEIVLEGVFPDSGSVKGGSIIKIKGKNFLESPSIKCSFSVEGQAYINSADYLTSELISCNVPRLPSSISRADTISVLQVSNNGVDFSSKGLAFHHRQEIKVETIEPKFVSENGETNVTVIGRNFFYDSTLSCIFEDGLKNIVTIANYMSATMLKCALPAVAPGVYSLSVSVLKMVSCKDEAIVVYPQIRLMSMLPTQGPFCGGTNVEVSGENFPNTTSLQCKFGTTKTKAVYVSARQIMCISPRLYFNESTIVKVSVSGNGQAFADNSDLRFLYKDDHSQDSHRLLEGNNNQWNKEPPVWNQVKLLGMTPRSGLVTGGQKVTLFGSGFYANPNAACKFGIFVTKAIFISSDKIECKSPEALSPGIVDVDITMNRINWTDKNLDFMYFIPIHVNDVRPRKLPMHGGTVIHVSSSGIDSTMEMFCKFGPAGMVRAVVPSSNLLTCVSPVASKPEEFFLDILVDDTSIILHGLFKLEFVSRVSFSIYPKFGPKEGNTPLKFIMNEDYHMELDSNDDFVCSFEFKNGEVKETKVELINSTYLSCLTPNISDDMIGFREDFFMANVNIKNLAGGFSLTNPIYPTFTFKTLPINATMVPLSGAVNGGTRVTLQTALSTELWLNSNSFTCMFGTTLVHGNWLSKNKVECIAPPVTLGSLQVPLSIAENGVNFVTVGYFNYQSPPSILSVDKYHLYEGVVSDIIITISGLVTFDKPTCLFQNYDQPFNFTTQAIVGSSSILKCSMLPRKAGETFYLRVSNNGDEFSIDFHTLKVIPMPSLISLKPTSGISGEFNSISVKGAHFREDSSWHCILKEGNDILFRNVATVFTVSSIYCDIQCPPVLSPKGYEIVLKTNGIARTSSFMFWCIPEPSIADVFPSRILVQQEPVMTVYGEGFTPYLFLKCVFSGDFGRLQSDSKYVDEKTIICSAPRIQSPQMVQLEITSDGIRTLKGLFRIQILPQMIILSVEPQTLIAGSAIKVKVDFGTKELHGMNCRVGGFVGRYMEWEDDQTIKCHTTFDLAQGNYTSLEFFSHDFIIEAPESFISVVSRPFIHDIQPRKAVIFYQTTIKIIGYSFMGYNGTCHFGSKDIKANIHSDSLMSCEAPASQTASLVEFTIAIDKVSSLNKVMFEYIKPWVINEIFPKSGPIQGGTKVTMYGKNFDPLATDVKCFFGHYKSTISAQVISDSSAVCISPTLVYPQNVAVSFAVTNEGTKISILQDRYSSVDEFYFYDERSVQDNLVVINHGKNVIVNGSWFYELQYEYLLNPTCRFDHHEVAANLNPARSFLCRIPSGMSQSLNMTLKVSLNGIDYLDESFSIHNEALVIHSTIPSSGPTCGGTPVELVGIFNLIDVKDLQCRFGTNAPSYAFVDSSNNKIFCITPAVKEAVILQIYLRSGAQEKWSDTGKIFKYLDNVYLKQGTSMPVTDQNYQIESSQLRLVSHIYPRIGPSNGGTKLIVYGTGFVSSDELLCWFGEYATMATYISSTSISCRTSAYYFSDKQIQKVPFSVRSQKNLWMNNITYYYYQHFLQSDSILLPSRGPTQGGTSVQIKGRLITNILASNIVGSVIRFEDVKVRFDSKLINTSLGDNYVEFFTSQLQTNMTDTVILDAPIQPVSVALSFNGGLNFISCPVFNMYHTPLLTTARPQHLINGFHTGIFIEGRQFPSFRRHLTCSIGGSKVVGRLETNEIAFCPLPWNLQSHDNETLTTLSISFNEKDFSSNFLPIFIQPTPTITEITPKYICNEGGTTVKVEGSHFISMKNSGCSVCLFRHTPNMNICSSIQLKSDTEFSFTAPSGFGESIEIRIGCGTEYFRVSSLTLTYISSPQLHSVTKVDASVDRGYSISVTGRNFVMVSSYSCLISSGYTNGIEVIMIDATIINETALICTVPSNETFFELSREGVATMKVKRFIDSSISNEIIFYLIYPVAQQSLGIMTVIDYESEIAYLNNSDIDSLDDSICNTQFSDQEITIHPNPEKPQFNFYDLASYPFIKTIDTLLESFHGGSRLRVTGGGFEGDIFCIFGTKSSPAIILNSTTMECHIPAIYGLFESLHLNTEQTVNVDFKFSMDRFRLPHEGDGTTNILSPTMQYPELYTNLLPSLSTFTYSESIYISTITPKSLPSAGNVAIRITGRGFLNSPYLSCKVGLAEARKAYFINVNLIECIIPSAKEAFGSNVLRDQSQIYLKKAYVTVSNNGKDFEQDRLNNMASLSYYNNPTFLEYAPRSGVAGVNIYLHATSLPFAENPLCQFGNYIVKAAILPPATVICTTPSVREKFQKVVRVSISWNGFNFFDTGFAFEFVELPVATLIEPSFGPDIGGNIITVFGSNFEMNRTILCNFGGSFTNATVLSNEELICRTPPREAGLTMFSLRCLDQDSSFQDSDNHNDSPFHSETYLSYTYLKDFLIEKLIPKYGPHCGNTRVTLMGQNFGEVDSLACFFGETAGKAIFISERHIVCHSPMYQKEPNQWVEVRLGILSSNNTITFLSTSHAKSYLYVGIGHINEVHPSRGLISGGDKIKVKGENFVNSVGDKVVCMFGKTETVGTWISSTEVECLSPSMQSSWDMREVQRIVISRNGTEDLTPSFVLTFDGKTTKKLSYNINQEDLRLELQSLETIGEVRVSNSTTYHQNSRNDTFISYDVTFTTLGNPPNIGNIPLLQVEMLQPLFGTSSEVIKIQESCCEIKLSFNFVDYFGGINGSMVSFTFDDDILVTNVSPAHGSIKGGTPVIISGKGFHHINQHLTPLFCVFGTKYVQAQLTSADHVECLTPIFPSPAKVILHLELYADVEGFGRSIQSMAEFEFISDPEVFKTFPLFLPPPEKFKWNVLDVFGQNFIRSDDLGCYFVYEDKTFADYQTLKSELTTTATFHNSTYIQCLTDSNDKGIFHWTKTVTLHVTTNGIDRSKGYDIDVVKSHFVHDIFPSSGPFNGGTEVMITGGNFIDVETLSCRFGRIPPVRAIFQSPKAIKCVSPFKREDDENTVVVAVSNNGYHYAPSPFVFYFYHDLELLSIAPSVGPSIGGTSVSVKLKNGLDSYNNTTLCVCRFNETHVPGNKVKYESNVITCQAPPTFAHGGIVSFEVSMNGFDFSSSGFKFLYLPGQRSDSLTLSPSHGPKSGGTLVSVAVMFNNIIPTIDRINWIPSHKPAVCKFGDVLFPAENVVGLDGLLSSGLIGFGDKTIIFSCRSPHASLHNNASSISVDISLTGATEDFTNISAMFQYDQLITISEINPDTGSSKGGTAVQVYGGPFIDIIPSELLCRFGSTIVRATWKSSDVISCVTPELEERQENETQSIPVAISINGVDFSESTRVFHYKPDYYVKDIKPNHGYAGSNILVEGVNFFPNFQFLCHFGAAEKQKLSNKKFHAKGVPLAKYLNATHLVCVAPPHSTVGYVPFSISIDGTVISDDQGTLLFHYDAAKSIREVFPVAGPTTGKFLVTIYGGPFHNPFSVYKCRYGSIIVNATYFSSSKIACTAPSQVSGMHQMQISQNGQDFSDDFVMIHFYKPTRVEKLLPISGPTMSSGSQVHLFGSNFINLTTSVCKFDETPVPSTFVSMNEIICTTPSLFTSRDLSWEKLSEHSNIPMFKIFPEAHDYPLYLSKLVKVEVSMNGQDFTELGHTFLFQDDIHVNHLIPSEGPSTGGTPVFIHGSGFVNGTLLSCRFGHHVSKGIFLTRNLVLCFSPPHSNVYITSNSTHETVDFTFLQGPVHKILEIFVEISNNALDFTDFQTVYRYLPKIQEGFYQQGVDKFTVLKCPRGSYCKGDFNFNFTMCPRGTYQPLPGQTTCERCPIGFMCPEQGLPVPRICPAGFVCDVTGIENAIQPCPSGFYCPTGTVTSATFCGSNSNDVNELSVTFTLSELTTLRKGHVAKGNRLVIGGRSSICWDNSTDDHGLQMSNSPGRFWSEIRTLPLDVGTSVAPIRGRYCQDDACLNVEDPFEASILSAFTLDSTTFFPQKPIPCPPGTYCHPGSSIDYHELSYNTAPRICDGKRYCPEGSTNPAGVGECPQGYFCRFGKKKACPIGTFCPFSNMWDPLPCEPGTFNFMVGQVNCTSCPFGYYCNGYGKIEPSLCPPGFVCSKDGLASPNIRCPPGFYCSSGTQTSDPFRNDTTLRPYPCSPGTYCVGGTGYSNVHEGNFSHAQPCTQGFFCDSASTSAKGSGLCPQGFYCPKGTAAPIPTPKGHYAKLPGTVHPAVCLPGFYAPTIESTECIPCPPGTTCEVEGLFTAEICPPGSFRSILEANGIACQTCPQGTWSKNWHLRDEGECTTCPAGVVCPIDGMTVPCSKDDLPTPYEPVLNLDGIPVLEFKFASSNAPPSFSIGECMQLNFASNDNLNRYSDPHYFFGELIPPYIDILGRGSHIRITDEVSTKYSGRAKCYRNLRPRGSVIYERMAAYYGPQYDIQTGYPHQGYGSENEFHPMFRLSQFERMDHVDNLHHFFGQGTMYIDLPRSALFDPSLNCTNGFSLMNSTLDQNRKEIVYTSSIYDYEGGIDVKRCSEFDHNLNCFIDPTHQLHVKGECCNIAPRTQRAIYLAADQYYPGTCEADIICSDEQQTEAVPCQDGFVCAEKSTSQSGMLVKCPPGYICPFGTTPDDSLVAPRGHFSNICPSGYYCENGTGLDTSEYQCPMNFYCPAGTADPLIGAMANDAANRFLKEEAIDTNRGLHNLVYFGDDSFQLLSDNEAKCISSIDSSLENRFSLVSDLSLNSTIVIRNTIKYQIECERDRKGAFIKDALKRGTCNCNAQLFVVIAVYRLWQCTTSNNKGSCSWPHADVLTSNRGKIPMEGEILDSQRKIYLKAHVGVPIETGGVMELTNHGTLEDPDFRFTLHFNRTHKKTFRNFWDLKEQVVMARANFWIHEDLNLFNLYHAVGLVERFEQKLEQLVYFRVKRSNDDDIPLFSRNVSDSHDSKDLIPGRLDICECPDLLRCPYGTKTLYRGSATPFDCIWDGHDILERSPLVPQLNSSSKQVKQVMNQLSFTDKNSIVETLELQPYEVAVFQLDLSNLTNNMTYSDHYRVAVYEDCQPCPKRYICDQSTSCSQPSLKMQFASLTNCLKEYRKNVCVHKNGTTLDFGWCTKQSVNYSTEALSSSVADEKSELLLYTEPDLMKCLSLPLFCEERHWNYKSFRKLCQDTLEDGSKGPIYDCVAVKRWEKYKAWKDTICCSNLNGFDNMVSCNNNTCSTETMIHDVIKKRYHKTFVSEYGFEPPLTEPKGDFIMNAALQEDFFNPNPLSLFNEEQETTESVDNMPWMTTESCCSCQPLSLPQFFQGNKKVSGFPDDKHRDIQLTISAIKRVNVTIAVELLHGYYYNDFISTITDTGKKSLHIHRPSRFESSDLYMWLCILDKRILDRIPVHLPLNLPPDEVQNKTIVDQAILIDQPCEKSLIKAYELHHLSINQVNETLNNLSYYNYDDDGRLSSYSFCSFEKLKLPTESEVWRSNNNAISSESETEISFIALPYIPFFSSCSGYDSHISLSRLLEEHPDCHLVPHEATQPVKQNPFSREHTPISDTCINEMFDDIGLKQWRGISLNCQYEEEISLASDRYRWYEVESDNTLFQITSDAISSAVFLNEISRNDEPLQTTIWNWGRSRRISDSRKVPVRIHNVHGGMRNVIPRKVIFELQYYQIDRHKKRLVDAIIHFVDKCSTIKPQYFGGDPDMLRKLEELGIYPCETDYNGNLKSSSYELQILFYPLDWFQLLNRFQFDGPVYVGFYTLTGVISVTMGAVVWIVTYISTKLRHPPKFNGVSMIKLIGHPSLFGCILSSLTILFSIFVIFTCFALMDNIFKDIQGDWFTSVTVIDQAVRETNQKGRSGLLLIATGSYILFSGAYLIIPSKVRKDEINSENDKLSTFAGNDTINDTYSSNWKPRLWKRSNFISIAIFFQFVLLAVWEFSYSPSFESNLLHVIISLRLVEVVVEMILMFLLKEKLLCAPFMVLIGLTEVLITMSATDFVEFIILYFIQISLTVFQKIYFNPFVKRLQSLYPKWLFSIKQKMTSKQRKSVKRKQIEENMKKSIDETIELRNEGVEPLIDVLTLSSIQMIGRQISSFAYVLTSIFYGFSEIAEKYGISKSELQYYVIFAFNMIPWSVLVDIFVLNSQELVHGWRLHDYLEYQRHRFVSREKRWTLDSPNFDESITESLQSIDCMSFSSQYYFLVSFLSSGMFINIFGMTILLRCQNYNALGDPAMPIIISANLLFCRLLQFIIENLGALKLEYIDFQGIWGTIQLEGTMDDIVAAKLTVGDGCQVDLESERLELEALNDENFRQRFLDRNKPWILHHIFELLTVSTEVNSFSDRSFFLEKAKGFYSQLSVVEEGKKRLHDSSDISSDGESQDFTHLSSWNSLKFEGSSLEIMKFWIQNARKRFIFSKVVENQIKNSVNTICSSCSRNKGQCESLKSYLAKNGKRQASALDELITQFSIKHLQQKNDLTSWKSFFRQNAEIITLCNFCVYQSSDGKEMRSSGTKIPIRPGDISSDDEEDETEDIHISLYSPMVVTKDSLYGKLLSKWLYAARHQIGGHFPRPEAKKYAEKYINRMKETNAIMVDVGRSQESQKQEISVTVKLDSSSKLVMKKWLTIAKQNLESTETYEE